MMTRGEDSHPEGDPRWNALGISQKKLQDFVSAICLDERVSQDVAKRFETIKKLLAYSYFEYEFVDVAFDQALLTFEMALAQRYFEIEGMFPKSKRKPKQNMNLHDMIKWGSDQSLFEDPEPVVQNIRNLRNSSAHPKRFQMGGFAVLDIFPMVAEIVNGLYEDVEIRRRRINVESETNKSFDGWIDTGGILEMDGKRYIIFLASLLHFENRIQPHTYHFAFWPIFDPSKCSQEMSDYGEPLPVSCSQYSTNGVEHYFTGDDERKITLKKIELPEHVEKYKHWLDFYRNFVTSDLGVPILFEIGGMRRKLKRGTPGPTGCSTRI